MKKKLLLIVIMTCILILISCEKKDLNIDTLIEDYKGMTIIEEVGMTNVFSSNRIKPTNRFNFLEANFSDTVFIMDDRIYVASKMGVDKENGYFFEKVLQSYDINGDNEEFFIIEPIVENSTVEFMWYDSNYNIITIEQLDYEYTLNKRTKTNELTFTIQLNIFEEIISMVIGEYDNIYFGTKNKVIIYSTNGDFICELPLEYQLDYISSAHNKKPILKMYDTNNSVHYQYVNYEIKSFEELEISIKPIYYAYSNILYGEGYDYYHVTNNGVYGYDIESNTLTKKLDWINSDIKYIGIKTFGIISPDKMLLIQFDYSVSYTTFTILNRQKEITDKIYLSIGYINPYTDAYLEGVVYNFNKNNNKYRITIKNYYSQYDELDPILRLNNDIASGDSPDMILMNDHLSIINYSKNDMFIDLNQYLNQEDELKNNLFPIAKDSTINNKLYQMITSFTITTLMGKSENIGNKTSWSFKDVINLNSNNSILSLEFTKISLTNNILPYLISYYVDYDKGVCDFDKQDFKEFIELYKMVPDNYLGYNLPDFENTFEYLCSLYRNDEVLVDSVIGIDVASFIGRRGRIFRDKEVTIIGYPTPDGKEHRDKINAKGFSILNTSNNKEAAWEFIKYCLSDEYAEISVFENGNIIPTKTGIELTNNKYRDMYIYVTDDYKTLLHNNMVNDIQNQYGTGVYLHINDDVINEFNSYLYSIDNYVHNDKDVINIIRDELKTYVNSNKSMDDTIKAIQSRVSIYMSEMWG